MPQTHDRISAGVKAGIITPDQGLALRKLPLDGDAQQFTVTRTGDEPFALFRGFRDVFLAIGIIILTIGLGGVASEVLGLQFDGQIGWDDAGLTACLAAIAWGVGEWVTGRLRMPLSSLVTAAAFSFAVMATLMLILINAKLDSVLEAFGVEPEAYAALFFALGALAFYLRFALPAALAFFAGGIAFALFKVIEVLRGGDVLFQPFALIAGLLIFAVAISYELRDPTRTRRQSENAFWLHLLAAPLIVFALTGGQDAFGIGSTGDAVRIFFVVVVLGLIALLIDRRAFLVSALLYLGGAIAYTISQSGMPTNVQFASTALVLGLFVVSLALGWQPLRRAFLGLLPHSLSTRLPNTASRDALGG